MAIPRLLYSLVILGVLLAIAPSATASDLFAVNFAGSTLFFQVDQSSAALTVVKNAAATNIGDLTSNQADKVWGVVLPSKPPGWP